ncbi:hypothetical protein [uncultured Nostoc sp.]|uniref:hypothetical protein n=1 Tax=uncultured Nostoc sp. TaxID=340711 RepID=UPI00262A75BE|nr:hypothetical protein [uncultured Nostoc sp.]
MNLIDNNFNQVVEVGVVLHATPTCGARSHESTDVKNLEFDNPQLGLSNCETLGTATQQCIRHSRFLRCS